MKTFIKVIFIIAGSLLILGGIIVAVSFAGHGFRFGRGFGSLRPNYNASNEVDAKEFTVAAEDVRSIDIDEVHYDVKIVCGDSDMLRVEYEENDRMRYEIYLRGGKLSIRHLPRYRDLFVGWIPSIGDSGTLTVYLPADFALADDLRVNTVSASVQLNWSVANSSECLLIGGKLSIESASGDINVENVRAQNGFTANCVSGNIKLSSCESNGGFTSENVSGETILTGCTVGGRMSLHSVSGNILAKDSSAAREIKIESVSGNISLINSTFAVLACENVSGNVELELPQGEYRFEFETLSGRKEYNMPSYPSGITVDIETVSGDIRVRSSNS